MHDLRPYLLKSGITFENKEPIEILGMKMDRVLMRRPGSVLAIGFGGGYFHVVQMIGLTRSLTPKEIVDYNASTQLFNLTPSNPSLESSREPSVAIIKAHVPAGSGAVVEALLSLLTLSEDATEKLVSLVGKSDVRSI